MTGLGVGKCGLDFFTLFGLSTVMSFIKAVLGRRIDERSSRRSLTARLLYLERFLDVVAHLIFIGCRSHLRSGRDTFDF